MTLLLIVPLFAASCGSGGKDSGVREVGGPGFRFSAPAGWRVRTTATSAVARASAKAGPLVSAAAYRLERAYTPDRFAEAARELDAVAAKLARAAGGTLTSRETTTVDGRRIRAYRFTATSAGRRYDDRVGFVLSGKREVQLLCQSPAGSGDVAGACALLFSSFRLSG